MTPGHNWMNNPVTRKRDHLLARLHIKGMLTNEWRSAILSGALDQFEVLQYSVAIDTKMNLDNQARQLLHNRCMKVAANRKQLRTLTVPTSIEPENHKCCGKGCHKQQ